MKEYYTINGIPPGEPTMKGSNADPYVADVALPNAELGDYSVPTDWPTNVRKNAPGDVPGAPVMFEDDDQGDVKAGYGFESDNLYEGDWFFFHTDHLGSTSYLTDTAGNVSQFVCYTPYGEAIVDEHLTTYENPFKFSGKELDDITGLYDHGARSRNPVSTLWYGVDPLFEKYPDFSPYNYCAGNPVKLVDEDGRKWEDPDGNAIPEEDLKNIRVYIFYTDEFKEQAKKQYDAAIKQYGAGSVAMSNTGTADGFKTDWGNMSGDNIAKVLIMAHGKNQSINIGNGSNVQFTATGNNQTNISHSSADNIQDLPNPNGDISKAELYLYTCHSADDKPEAHGEGNHMQGPLEGGKQTVAAAFANYFYFKRVWGTRGSVNYHSFWTDLTSTKSNDYMMPYPEDGKWFHYYR